jgi:hypothetical protein
MAQQLAALAAAAAIAISPSACTPQAETGFVEIKRTFPQTSQGVYRLNGEDVAGLEPGAAATVVVRQKTGATKVEFYRDTRTYLLCDFTLGRNRIVTVTLFLDNREIKCSVQL